MKKLLVLAVLAALAIYGIGYTQLGVAGAQRHLDKWERVSMSGDADETCSLLHDDLSVDIKDQSTASANGIYVVAASGSPTRAADADTSADLNNATVYVTSGTVNGGREYTQTTANPTVGTSNIVFVQKGTGGTYTAGTDRREQGRRPNEGSHKVTLSRPFYMGEREVTNGQFRQFDPSHNSGSVGNTSLDLDKQPVVKVTWDQAARRQRGDSRVVSRTRSRLMPSTPRW